MTIIDPDEPAEVRLRELRAALALIDGLIHVLDTQPELAQDIYDALPRLDVDLISSLPEVGPIDSVEALRLHLDRLDERLRCCLSDALPAPIPPPPVTQPKPGPIPLLTPSRSGAIEGDPNAEAFVWWDDITSSDVDGFMSVLATAQNEHPLQKHLALNPKLLVQHLAGGHGRWVFPQKRLGSEFVLDFAISERSSSGFEWQFVELQSPRAVLFVPSSGRQSSQLDEGIRQIQEWRRWLGDNIDYARRDRVKNGLGLTDVSSRSPGLLIIGREQDLKGGDLARRRQLDEDLNIRIHTYDWLIRSAQARLRDLHRRED